MATDWQASEVGDTAHWQAGRAEANQYQSSEFLHELRISGFPRFWVSPTYLHAKLLWIDAMEHFSKLKPILSSKLTSSKRSENVIDNETPSPKVFFFFFASIYFTRMAR